MKSTRFSLLVNGKRREFSADPDATLLTALRESLEITSPKRGCNQGVCGSCTVMVNGQPQRACLTLAATCEGKAITTVEGFHDDPLMKVLQDQFQRCGAVQCGFCTAGVLISAYKLLSEVQDATAEDVRAGLSGNICRCTGYRKILDGVLGAAQEARS
tara:strand:+ start:170 stop:643 length:474 start_codon:yes stop_codon:yes gene_type:complete